MAPQRKHFLFAIYQLSIIIVCLSQSYPGERCRNPTGSDGICRLLSECPDAQDNLKKGIRPLNCGFQNKDPIVCCNSTVTTTKPNELRKADYWCNMYNAACPGGAFIAGGEPALPEEFPHMAAIGYGPYKNIKWSCGGSLISEKFILTAAHCLHLAYNGPAQWVLLGTELLTNTTSPGRRKGQIHPVARRIQHPEYKPPSKYNDVALLEIGVARTPNPLPTLGGSLHPACLPTNSLHYPSAIATGWGRQGHGEDGSPELLKVKLDILEADKCNKAFDVEIRTTNRLRKGIDSTMICAGVLAGGKDTCQGDSGGPLQQPVWSACVHVVLGITSFGKVCALQNLPAVYMRVSEYVPWIEKIVWP